MRKQVCSSQSRFSQTKKDSELHQSYLLLVVGASREMMYIKTCLVKYSSMSKESILNRSRVALSSQESKGPVLDRCDISRTRIYAKSKLKKTTPRISRKRCGRNRLGSNRLSRGRFARVFTTTEGKLLLLLTRGVSCRFALVPLYKTGSVGVGTIG